MSRFFFFFLIPHPFSLISLFFSIVKDTLGTGDGHVYLFLCVRGYRGSKRLSHERLGMVDSLLSFPFLYSRVQVHVWSFLVLLLKKTGRAMPRLPKAAGRNSSRTTFDSVLMQALRSKKALISHFCCKHTPCLLRYADGTVLMVPKYWKWAALGSSEDKRYHYLTDQDHREIKQSFRCHSQSGNIIANDDESAVADLGDIDLKVAKPKATSFAVCNVESGEEPQNWLSVGI
ncbi:hypothetical protein MPH_11247 [Macrophomina phaseolina MS6]|uniref:Uncharacterized protein n=1 Tax=Macrophomina phaseolina (strain MS6) TaxID=1126212 RepID=K2RB34_MACPH|nr:hypothetical protein MPH_11247 [Macrophomina phaseolina MS6]